jgi:hypothetical protein
MSKSRRNSRDNGTKQLPEKNTLRQSLQRKLHEVTEGENLFRGEDLSELARKKSAQSQLFQY